VVTSAGPTIDAGRSGRGQRPTLAQEIPTAYHNVNSKWDGQDAEQRICEAPSSATPKRSVASRDECICHIVGWEPLTPWIATARRLAA
jgi:hypothetical protein